ncbi:MMS19 nucleotide excision repair homolog, partial [Paramuricea clavata]
MAVQTFELELTRVSCFPTAHTRAAAKCAQAVVAPLEHTGREYHTDEGVIVPCISVQLRNKLIRVSGQFTELKKVFKSIQKKPSNDPNAITREQLIIALRKCLAATSIFAPFCLPLLIEKLSSDVVYAKKDALLTLAACANVYDSRFITEYVDSLWNYIKKEIFTAADQSIEIACLEAIKNVVGNISIAEEAHACIDGDFVFSDCKNHLLKPDHKLMKTSASLLQNVAMASDMACARVTDQVIPILLEQFELHKQINNQKSILDAMLGFLQVAKDFVNKDTAAILKTYKEKLLGLFFSLLVNHNPLHRSSGVAGLVAMVSSALLDEQEVMTFLDHLVVLILDDKEKIVRHEAKLALAYLSSQFPALVRSRVVVQLTDRLAKKDGSNSMETDNDANTVPVRPHITHEYLVTTLATLCTSQENVEYIVPCLVENLTTLSESTSTNSESYVVCVVDCLQNIFEGCLRSSLKILDYYKDVIFLRVLNLAIANSLGEQECSFTSAILEKFCKLLRTISSKLSETYSEFIVSTVGEIFLDGKLDRANLPDGLNKQDFDVLN